MIIFQEAEKLTYRVKRHYFIHVTMREKNLKKNMKGQYVTLAFDTFAFTSFIKNIHME